MKPTAYTLGNASFRKTYGAKYAYAAGSMYKGISSSHLLVNLARAGMLGYFGSGGLSPDEVEAAIADIQAALPPDAPYGVNLLFNPAKTALEDQLVDLYLSRRVRNVEASAYMCLTPAVVRFRLAGIFEGPSGIEVPNRVMAKVSRLEIARQFMEPPPFQMVRSLVEQGGLTLEQAQLAQHIPVAQDICVESDSAGHTDKGVALAMLPEVVGLRDLIQRRRLYAEPCRVGSAGGLGTPQAISAVFMLGADFVMTGSINQCTPEAATSSCVKDLLQALGVRDTGYAPAGDLFEWGAKVQVVKKGLMFPVRANKLYDLYVRHGQLEEIDRGFLSQIEEKYFKRSVDSIYEEIRHHRSTSGGDVLAVTDEMDPKAKMAAVFRWYFMQSAKWAREGRNDEMANFQIHCGPAMGAFNRWAEGTELEPWSQRAVARIGAALMEGAAECMSQRYELMSLSEPTS